MDKINELLVAFELHDEKGIRNGFESGIHPNDMFQGKPLLNALINMYTRGPKFRKCIKVFVDYGLAIEDKILLAVFLDDTTSLDILLDTDKTALFNRYSFDASFTPLNAVSLLHICAEFNHLECAKVLVKHGADINFQAGLDEHGFGGQTPIFHTVNQDANKSIDVLKFLLSQKAELTFTVKGLIWGKGCEWETFIPSVNPLSYAMMGLLRQFQRTEKDIYDVISLMLHENYGMDYFPKNVPNKYLMS